MDRFVCPIIFICPCSLQMLFLGMLDYLMIRWKKKVFLDYQQWPIQTIIFYDSVTINDKFTFVSMCRCWVSQALRWRQFSNIWSAGKSSCAATISAPLMLSTLFRPQVRHHEASHCLFLILYTSCVIEHMLSCERRCRFHWPPRWPPEGAPAILRSELRWFGTLYLLRSLKQMQKWMTNSNILLFIFRRLCC